MIRQANLSDLESILDVIKEAQARMKNSGMTQWQNDYPNRDIIYQDIVNNSLYVYILDGVVCGTMSVFSTDSVYEFIDGKWLNENAYKVIHRIAVSNRALGKNISGEMIDFVFNTFDIKDIRIDTHPLNTPMIKSLERQNFIYCGIVHVTTDTDSLRLAFQKHLIDIKN